LWLYPRGNKCVPIDWGVEVKKISKLRVKGVSTHLSDFGGLEKLPQLRAFLADTTLEGEHGPEERLPGSIYIQPRGGKLCVTLKEPSQALMLRAEVERFSVLWPQIEAMLGDEGSMWELDPWAKKPRKQKKG